MALAIKYTKCVNVEKIYYVHEAVSLFLPARFTSTEKLWVNLNQEQLIEFLGDFSRKHHSLKPNVELATRAVVVQSLSLLT